MPGVHWLDSLTTSVSWFSENPCLRNQAGCGEMARQLRALAVLSVAPDSMVVYRHTCRQDENTHTINQINKVEK